MTLHNIEPIKRGLNRALSLLKPLIRGRQNLALILLAILMSSCVSIKSYRQTKSQMLYNEFEIKTYIFIVDSLSSDIVELEQSIVIADSTINSQDSILKLSKERINMLTEEYALLMEELQEQK